MNPSKNPRLFRKASALRIAPLVLAVLAYAVPARAQTQPAKPYALFLGTDLAVKTPEGVFPVWDVSGGAWVIRKNGAPVVMDAKQGPTSLKMRTIMRLTESTAQVTNLRREQDYTPGNDPYTKFTKATNEAASQYAGGQFAANAANAAMTLAIVASSQASAANPSSPPVTAQQGSVYSAGASETMANAQQQTAAATMTAGATPGLVTATGGNMDTESYDALDVAFDVASPKTLDRPYLVVICRYHERGGPPGSYRDWINARALDPIGPKPAHIHFLAGGFPPGYDLQSFELHLYNHGAEVATNLSPKRSEFTLDEAFDYYRKIYLSSHKGDTLPAVPALGQMPPDLQARLDQGQVAKAVYVSVSPEGLGVEAFLDPGCTRKVDDPYVRQVVGGIRFKPALKGGDPVPGVVLVQLDRLSM